MFNSEIKEFPTGLISLKIIGDFNKFLNFCDNKHLKYLTLICNISEWRVNLPYNLISLTITGNLYIRFIRQINSLKYLKHITCCNSRSLGTIDNMPSRREIYKYRTNASVSCHILCDDCLPYDWYMNIKNFTLECGCEFNGGYCWDHTDRWD